MIKIKLNSVEYVQVINCSRNLLLKYIKICSLHIAVIPLNYNLFMNNTTKRYLVVGSKNILPGIIKQQ